MDAASWRRRRRRALAIVSILIFLPIAALTAVALLSDGATRWSISASTPMVALLPILVVHLVLLLSRRPRALERLRRIVVEATGDDAAMLVQVVERQGMWWIGVRGIGTPFLVLVDDAVGYALWTVRRGVASEVMRCPWDAVDTAVAVTDVSGVDLVPRDAADPTVRVIPTDLRDDRLQRIQTPSRDRAFAAHVRERIRTLRPDAAPEPRAESADVDWLAPPDRTRPSR